MNDRARDTVDTELIRDGNTMARTKGINNNPLKCCFE